MDEFRPLQNRHGIRRRSWRIGSGSSGPDPGVTALAAYTEQTIGWGEAARLRRARQAKP